MDSVEMSSYKNGGSPSKPTKLPDDQDIPPLTLEESDIADLERQEIDSIRSNDWEMLSQSQGLSGHTSTDIPPLSLEAPGRDITDEREEVIKNPSTRQSNDWDMLSQSQGQSGHNSTDIPPLSLEAPGREITDERQEVIKNPSTRQSNDWVAFSRSPAPSGHTSSCSTDTLRREMEEVDNNEAVVDFTDCGVRKSTSPPFVTDACSHRISTRNDRSSGG